MKAGVCPKCGYRYSWREYLKLSFSKFIWVKWNCKKCNTQLTFSPARRLIVALLVAVLLYGFFMLKDAMEPNFLNGSLLVIMLIPAVVALYVLLDRFKEA
ncbi:MAG: hypothetical protein K9I29_09725 [Bacteroidales bacterium]|nr:hypothetical protein [Bacteroidales bacterium]MCF8328558.1 hypothetical protein [Bacteroidales bacterium]